MTTTAAMPDLHHPVFSRFDSVAAQTVPHTIYDFLGGATRTAFKRAWAKHGYAAGKTVRASLPPKNEHYLDWIAVLTAIDRARGTFRMIELGAGWGPWLVRGALAARQRPDITGIELLGVEADPVHYGWMREHFRDNGLDPDAHRLLQGAVAGVSGAVSFPVIDNPDEDYGARIGATGRTIAVRAYTLPELLAQLSGPVDFLHVDIQGAEYEVLPPAVAVLRAQVRLLMVGTHRSDAAHDGLAEALKAAGLREVMNLARNRTHATPWGEIALNDGFLLFETTAG